MLAECMNSQGCWLFYLSGSVNFACGRSDSFTDSNGTPWTGDADYIYLGVAAEVNDTAGVPESLTHLRWFNMRTCYTFYLITVGSSVTVTTGYYYGNFDGKDSPPQFQVQYDSNPVKTIVIGSQAVTYPLTYNASSDQVSVCFSVPPDDFTKTAFVNTVQIEGSGVSTDILKFSISSAVQSSGMKMGKAIIAVLVVIVIFLVLAGVVAFLVSRRRRKAQLAIQQGTYQGTQQSLVLVDVSLEETGQRKVRCST